MVRRKVDFLLFSRQKTLGNVFSFGLNVRFLVQTSLAQKASFKLSFEPSFENPFEREFPLVKNGGFL